MRAAALALTLAGCHSVIGLDAPPRGTGRTLLVIRARDSKVLAIDAVDATKTELDLPTFGRFGDLDIAVAEVSCDLVTLELKEGPLTLRDVPYDKTRLPLPKSIYALTIHGADAGAWVPVTASVPWIDLALRSVEGPENVRCLSAGFQFDFTETHVGEAVSLVPLAGGDVLVLDGHVVKRVTADREIEPTNIELTPTSSLGWTVGAQDHHGELWVLDERGRLGHGSIDGGPLTYVATATIPGVDYLTFDEQDGLYAATRTFGKDARLYVTYYDRVRDQWTRLHRFDATLGEGALTMLPLDHSVLIAGADFTVDLRRRGEVAGAGRLLELSPTEPPRWIEVSRPKPEERVVAMAIAQTELYGRVVSGLICTDSSDASSCSNAESVREFRGVITREVGDHWEIVHDFGEGVAIPGVANAGPEAMLVGELRVAGFGFQVAINARFSDGFTCTLDREGDDLLRRADGTYVVLADSERSHVLRVYQPRPPPPGCAD